MAEDRDVAGVEFADGEPGVRLNPPRRCDKCK
jgi:hypothetical protein